MSTASENSSVMHRIPFASLKLVLCPGPQEITHLSTTFSEKISELIFFGVFCLASLVYTIF